MAETVFLVVVLLVAATVPCWLLRDLREVTAVRERRARVTVSVVVPARDEQSTLPALLHSLAMLEGPVSEVVVVDDSSQDATAAVARSAGALVLPAGAPPTGWTGKAWACHVGAEASSGDMLLFLDADTTLAPGALGGLLALHDRHGGLVSVQPFHRVVRPYEHLSAYFNVVSLMASAAFAPGGSRVPMAFGPCLLTSRPDYELSGGHAAVRGEILDDVELAGAYHRAGLPVRCAVGGRSIHMRSYPGGLRQLAAGWSKNIASGAAAAAPAPTMATVVWLGAHHAVAVGAGLALLGVPDGPAASPTHGLMWVVAWVATAAQLRSVLRGIGTFGWWTWLLFPLPLLAFDLLFARSAVLTVVRRSVRWRGREVELSGHRSARDGV